MIGKVMLWIVHYTINPAILWCFGWKYGSELCMGKKFYWWTDPETGLRYSREKAIEKCEERLK